MTPQQQAAQYAAIMNAFKPVENKLYDTGVYKWLFMNPIRFETWNHQPSHFNYGPCPNCGFPTSNYGGGWSCHNDYCPSSSRNFACSAGPAPKWWGTEVNVFKDGNAWCATKDGFINLQESPAGFGDTPDRAVQALIEVLPASPAEPTISKTETVAVPIPEGFPPLPETPGFSQVVRGWKWEASGVKFLFADEGDAEWTVDVTGMAMGAGGSFYVELIPKITLLIAAPEEGELTNSELPHVDETDFVNTEAAYPPPESEWPDPTPEMLDTPEFEKIWQVIKSWDINVPSQYHGYCGATGNHVRAILDALAVPAPVAGGEEEKAEWTDTDRINWLQENKETVYVCSHEVRRPTTESISSYERVSVFDGWSTIAGNEPFPTIREAIDAALEAREGVR